MAIDCNVVAGNAADKAMNLKASVLTDAVNLVGGTPEQLPARVTELFSQWKKAKKGKLEKFELVSTESSKGSGLSRFLIVG